VHSAQSTPEDHAFDGRVVVCGVVDSVREPERFTFGRYEYPSMVPLEIQHRIMDMTRAVMQQIGFIHGPFNAEFFYDQVWLLEINPLANQSHADLFHGCTVSLTSRQWWIWQWDACHGRCRGTGSEA